MTAASRLTAFIVPAIFTTVASAQSTVTFEADGGIRVVRWIDMFGSTSVEMIAPPDMEMVECVALDAAGAPLAAGSGFPGAMVFADLDADAVADVTCRAGRF